VNLIKEVMYESRGYRNCNPGNIRRTASRWKGMREQQEDEEFLQFISMPYGYRAMLVILRNYHKLYGLTTIQQVIHRWAPPTENDTRNYITAVAQYLGIQPDDTLDFDDQATMCCLAAAISHYENGKAPNMEDIVSGYNMI
jgi:hypothetical protein